MKDHVTPAFEAAVNDSRAFLNNQKTYWANKTFGQAARDAVNGQPAYAGFTAEEYIAAQGEENIKELDAAYGPVPATS